MFECYDKIKRKYFFLSKFVGNRNIDELIKTNFTVTAA